MGQLLRTLNIGTPALAGFRLPPLFRMDFTDAAQLRSELNRHNLLAGWEGNVPAIGSPIAVALDPLGRPLSADAANQVLVPNFYLDPSITGELNPIVTFNRSSDGGRFNQYGAFEWVADNVPRIDHDPATYTTSTDSIDLLESLDFITINLSTSVTYTLGASVRVTYDNDHWFAGIVVSATGSAVTLLVEKVVGSGTFSAWHVIECLGLLVEESRQNSRVNSAIAALGTGLSAEQQHTYASVLAPDGSMDARVITALYPAGRAFTQGVIANGQTCVSLFFKAAAAGESRTLQLKNHNTDTIKGTTAVTTTGKWQRIFVQGVTDGASAGYRFEMIGHKVGDTFWAMQSESSTFPTSYIPTGASAVTRQADDAAAQAAQLSPILAGTSELTVTADMRTGAVALARAFAITNSDNSSFFRVTDFAASGRPDLQANLTGVTQATSNGVALSANAVFKVAASYKLNSFIYAQNGTIRTPDESGNIPDFSASPVLRIGQGSATGGGWINGHFRRMEIYRKQLSPLTHQALTL